MSQTVFWSCAVIANIWFVGGHPVMGTAWIVIAIAGGAFTVWSEKA